VSAPEQARAIRARVSGGVQGVGFREATRRRAGGLGLMGWVRNREDGTVEVHAEGAKASIETLIAFLRKGPRGAQVADLAVEDLPVEGHEQFAIRGVSAGAFTIAASEGRPGQFELSLEVDGSVRRWTLPKGPSMDPAVKRLAIEEEARPAASAAPAAAVDGSTQVWDTGPYEQGGRVPWPEALARGHAVFVLHGRRLRGGFALQRTRPVTPAQWLLIKRRDEEARPGSDVLAEQA